MCACVQCYAEIVFPNRLCHKCQDMLIDENEKYGKLFLFIVPEHGRTVERGNRVRRKLLEKMKR